MARRPPRFGSFIGQRRTVTAVTRLAEGCLERGKPLPHTALFGRAGLGKTAIAKAIAAHMGNFGVDDEPTNLHVVHAGRGSLRTLQEILVNAQHGDILFIDEAHALGAADAELLYLAMDRSETLGLKADGSLDRAHFQKIQEITIILATNIPGRLPSALRSRCVCYELDEYSPAELREIALQVAARHGLEPTSQAARVLVEHSDNTPRGVNQFLQLLATQHDGRVTQTQVESTLGVLGYSSHGLSPHQLRLLRVLAEAPNQAMRAENLKHIIGLDPTHVRTSLELPLIQRKLIEITGNHVRRLSAEGLTLVQQLALSEPTSSEPEPLAEEDDNQGNSASPTPPYSAGGKSSNEGAS